MFRINRFFLATLELSSTTGVVIGSGSKVDLVAVFVVVDHDVRSDRALRAVRRLDFRHGISHRLGLAGDGVLDGDGKSQFGEFGGDELSSLRLGSMVPVEERNVSDRPTEVSQQPRFQSLNEN